MNPFAFPPISRRRLLRAGGAAALGGALNVLGLEHADASPTAAGFVVKADLCVYGATSAGVIAAIAMHRLGKRAVIVEPGQHLGGLTAGGLGNTDIGNKDAIGGISREFYRRIRAHYLQRYGPNSPQLRDCRDGFRFEPHVAEDLYREMAAEAGVPIFFDQRLTRVHKRRRRIRQLVTEGGGRFRARMFVDATYEGDLLAAAGVSYTVGREANSKYGETLNGAQFGRPYHQFQAPVDPYVVPGDPASGLLPDISPDPPAPNGTGDRRVQAYCFRTFMTKNPSNQVPWPRPDGYDADRYRLLARYFKTGAPIPLYHTVPVPNGKTDTNNNGAISTDAIGLNYDWPEAGWNRRAEILREHVVYQAGLMWFLAHDPRVPPAVRDAHNRWGLARDEFTQTANWPHQLYVREGRRMIADVVMTEHHARGKTVAEDGVALAAYTMDSHNVQRVVKDGRVVNEGDVQVGGFPPYPISYRALIPHARECKNLLVPVCLSTSHIAYGSIRMEPVFMILGQTVATAAHLAIEQRTSVQDVSVAALQARLRADDQILEWTGPAPARPLIEPRPGEILVDDQDAWKYGTWIDSASYAQRRVGSGYVHDGNAHKGASNLVYVPNIPEEGEYLITLIYPPHPNRASNVPITVAVRGGFVRELMVDQRSASENGGKRLGRFRLPEGNRTTITVSNLGTNGYVVADGVLLTPRSLLS